MNSEVCSMFRVRAICDFRYILQTCRMNSVHTNLKMLLRILVETQKELDNAIASVCLSGLETHAEKLFKVKCTLWLWMWMNNGGKISTKICKKPNVRIFFMWDQRTKKKVELKIKFMTVNISVHDLLRGGEWSKRSVCYFDCSRAPAGR